MDDFDNWHKLKRLIDQDTSSLAVVPDQKEVWVCSLGKNIGYEQNGKGDKFQRPVLILKRFNKNMYWAIPLSTKQKQFYYYFNFTDPAGTKVSAIIAQLRLISVKRLTRKLYTVPNIGFELIRSKVIDLVKKNPA